MNLISASDLHKRIDDKNLIVIDVREPWEYDEECICSMNIPLTSIPKQLEELSAYKETEIVVHCQSGKRSGQAQKYLIKNGFTNVRSLEGGINAYLEEVVSQ